MVAMGYAQTAQTPSATTNAPDDKAGAYYNFAMGRLYAELAAADGGKNDYVSKAIQHYQEALKLDPSDSLIFEELTDLYIQTNRLRDAVAQAEDMLKQNPDNLDARRMLGRIYTRMVGDSQPGKIPEEYLRKAVEQYQKITEKDPNDAESWVMLGRLYRASNKSPESEKAYNQALKADPDNEDALTGLAMLYADLGDTKAAIEKLKAVTDKSPERPAAGHPRRPVRAGARLQERRRRAEEGLRAGPRQRPHRPRAGQGPALLRPVRRGPQALYAAGRRRAPRPGVSHQHRRDLSRQAQFRQGPRVSGQGQSHRSQQPAGALRRGEAPRNREQDRSGHRFA